MPERYPEFAGVAKGGILNFVFESHAPALRDMNYLSRPGLVQSETISGFPAVSTTFAKRAVPIVEAFIHHRSGHFVK